jgi:hypothetical protein
MTASIQERIADSATPKKRKTFLKTFQDKELKEISL